MKIGIVCYPTVGGSGVLATELGHELASKGHEVHFITYEVPFRLRLEEENIHFHEVEVGAYQLFRYPDYALPLAVKIVEITEEYDLDVLHVHYAIPHATSAYLAKEILGKEKLAVVTTLHGTDITLVGRDPSYFKVVKFSIEKSDGVTAVSQDLKSHTLDHFNLSKPIEVIYNFFIPKLEYYGHKPLRDQFVESDEKLLIHSSNYRPVKRSEDALEIFLKVRKKIKSKMLFIGSGPALALIRNRVQELDLVNDVIFVGENRVVDPYVASSDLFLLPSEQESFGLAALEAMAYGVPVVATDVGGLPEVVKHEKNGFLSSIGDIDDMADNAVQLLQNDVLYSQFSQKGKEIANNTFNVNKILPAYEAFYEKVLNQC